MTKRIVLTDSDILEGLRTSQVTPRSDEGYSTEEVMQQMSCGRPAARKAIRHGLQSGLLRLGKRWVVGTDGRHVPVGVYCPVSKQQKEAK